MIHRQLFASSLHECRTTAARGQALARGYDVCLWRNRRRSLLFVKGRDAHDYKFSSAVLEDYAHVSPAWRDRFLAMSVFNLKGNGHPDNGLVNRTRSALKG